MTIQKLKKQIVPILQKHHVKRAAVFGSVARGEETKNSDLDLLIELPKGKSLFDFIGLKQDIEDKMHKKIDLVEYQAIKPSLKPYILKDELPIYAAV